MALKADRHVETTDISFFYNEGTATRGGVVLHDGKQLASGATLGTTATIGAASGNLAVGRWMSRKDADGYAKVSVNLPNHGSDWAAT